VDIIGEGAFQDDWANNRVKLEINDIAGLDDSLIALVAWSETQAASSSSDRESRSYGLAVLETSGKTLAVSKFIELAYTPVSLQCF